MFDEFLMIMIGESNGIEDSPKTLLDDDLANGLQEHPKHGRNFRVSENWIKGLLEPSPIQGVFFYHLG
ncbi:hypothetical protein GQ457_01G014300 [Hibiscus cannabinus]